MNKTKEDNYFIELSKVNVNDKKKKKGSFTYLSWTYAVSELAKKYPEATWEVHEFDEGCPFKETTAGYFVKVSVTINNITKTQWHPVLDYSNKPVSQPNSFQVNTSIQRCLAKAIALHGLGLYIYANEDLPPEEIEQQEPAKPAIPLASDEQKNKIKSLIKITSVPTGELKEFLKRNHAIGNSIDTITVGEANLLFLELQKREKIMNEKGEQK